ncbi:MAG TPA: SDR family NAD(P)-dependent oxidoreductase, partial [Gryllotalpicola sp.]
ANKGIGKETARQLIAAGHTVYLGARNEQHGQTTAKELGAHYIHLDVTNDTSITTALTHITTTNGGLDILINNAGIEGRTADNRVVGPADETADHMREIFETNVFGLIRVTHAFLPLLQRSPAPVIVNLSSGLGSLTGLSDPDSFIHFYAGIAYPASKTAVNVITVQLAKAFPGIRVNAVDPGYTKTDLNGNEGVQTVAEGAELVVRMAQIGADGPTGQLVSAQPVAW